MQNILKLLDGQSSKVYHPAFMIGMNPASENSHTARQIAKMMPGHDVQKQM